MTYYAKIDPSASGASRVLGYYDTAFDPYKGVDFTQAGFVELTPEQWAARRGDSYHLNGQLVPKPAPTPDKIAATAKTVAQRQARTLLAASSESVVMRCVEQQIPVPAEWKAYRDALRAIIAGAATAIPTAPQLPTFA